MAADRHALLVATDTYSDPELTRLRAPAGDAQALAHVLADPSIGAFEVREPLINRTTDELRQDIEGFFDEARPPELRLLYISGHGVIAKDGRLYFATSSTKLTRLLATGIGEGFVNDVLRHSRARSIVLLLDCCHSGAFAEGLVPKGALSVEADHRFKGEGRVILTASDALEYAFEESATEITVTDRGALAPGSLFTRCVVEGLRSGDADVNPRDGRISIDELYDYVYGQVRARSPNQTPHRSGGGHGNILIARNPRALVACLPVDLVTLMTSDSADARLTAVDWLGRLLASSNETRVLAARDALERMAHDDSRTVVARVNQLTVWDEQGGAPGLASSTVATAHAALMVPAASEPSRATGGAMVRTASSPRDDRVKSAPRETRIASEGREHRIAPAMPGNARRKYHDSELAETFGGALVWIAILAAVLIFAPLGHGWSTWRIVVIVSLGVAAITALLSGVLWGWRRFVGLRQG